MSGSIIQHYARQTIAHMTIPQRQIFLDFQYIERPRLAVYSPERSTVTNRLFYMRCTKAMRLALHWLLSFGVTRVGLRVLCDSSGPAYALYPKL